jgi:(R,R)-butanediol dehydrogenase/meso-butanediol dehydrogenase/diacetyl reductase
MEQYLDITHGLKSDVVLDTGGNIPAIQLAVDLTAKKGRCVIVSVVADHVPIGALDVLLNEKEIIGSVGHTFEEEYPWSIQYMADGRIDLSPIITGKVYIEEALEKGLHKLQEDRNEIKILVTPHKDWI